MNRTTVFLVLVIVVAGVIIVVCTTGNDSPRPEPAPAATVKNNPTPTVAAMEPIKSSDESTPVMSHAGMMQAKMEPSGDNAVTASITCAPDEYSRVWTHSFLGAKSWRPPYPDDSDLAVRIVVKNLGSNPVIIASRKIGDDGFPVPVTANDSDYRLRETVVPKSELTVFKGRIGYYFKHWKSFGSLTTVDHDGIELMISIYFDGPTPDISKDIYLMSTRSAF